MKHIFAILIASAFLFGACSTQRVLVESHLPNQVRLTSHKHGCKLHKGAIVGYGAWGAWGEKSTANLVEGAKGPVRIEFKNTVGSWLLTGLLCPLGGCFFQFKTLEVYECQE
ncbi:hypothetical protein KKF34_07165 [Myxococcota bacterium]|nr:hypothetical protein [Myxococcota bacterium]MBU1382245.1 hypothetical protein [Myxococcota bacterium]MBU1496642.1 hypothetical protein [Myxococcota bacterium]